MTDALFNLSGKIIALSGGMGNLGIQFCKALLKRDARVAVLDIHADNPMPAQFEPYIEKGSLLTVRTDITRKPSLEQALDAIREKWGRVPSGLINNAALDAPPDAPEAETGPFENFPEASWDRTMDVNVKGVFLSCQVFGKAMADEGNGSIINIGSTYGLVSPDHRIYDYHREENNRQFYKPVAYAASKSALLNLTRYVAVYWAGQGVRANLLAFGGVYNNQDDAFHQAYCARVPMGRMARKDEYNGSVIYLLSDASSYITGTTIVADGGWTAW